MTHWTAFLLGVLALPAAAVAAAVAWQLHRVLAWAGGHVAARLMRFTPDSNRARARAGATFYAAQRSRVLVIGDLAVSVHAGLDPERVQYAYDRLYDPPTIRLAEKWRKKEPTP